MTDKYIASIISSDPGLPRENPTAPYWQKDPHLLASTQSPSLPETTDIAVIGSGITGASVTKTLLERHDSCNVTVLEARTLCSGATGRNGGQLAINAAQIYVNIKATVGAEMAGKIVRFNIETLRRLREVAAELDVVEYVELTDVVKLRCYQDSESFDHVERGISELEADHADLKGMYDVLGPERCEREHGVFGVVGGVLHPAGTIWPYRLVTTVFEVLAKRFPTRLAIETNTPVSGVIFDPMTDGKYPYRLSTPRGEVRATQVAYCTNGYTGHLLPSLRGSIYPLKGTMTVQDMGAGYENKGDSTSWAVHYEPYPDPKDETFADGLIYGMQNVKTGTMFFGGQKSSMADMLTADDTTLSSSSVAYLQEAVLSLLGHEPKPGRDFPSIVSSWSGIMCFSSDRMPLVGQLPSSLTHTEGGEWICAAYCGYGMPSAWLAGESLGQMILGRPPQDVLPEAYLITQERLERMSTKKSVERLHD